MVSAVNQPDVANRYEHVVNVSDGGLLIPAIGQTYTLSMSQVAVYFIRPTNHTPLSKATDSTVFVSDLPELRGYTFLCIPIRDDTNPNKVRYTYQLKRV